MYLSEHKKTNKERTQCTQGQEIQKQEERKKLQNLQQEILGIPTGKNPNSFVLPYTPDQLHEIMKHQTEYQRIVIGTQGAYKLLNIVYQRIVYDTENWPPESLNTITSFLNNLESCMQTLRRYNIGVFFEMQITVDQANSNIKYTMSNSLANPTYIKDDIENIISTLQSLCNLHLYSSVPNVIIDPGDTRKNKVIQGVISLLEETISGNKSNNELKRQQYEIFETAHEDRNILDRQRAYQHTTDLATEMIQNNTDLFEEDLFDIPEPILRFDSLTNESTNFEIDVASYPGYSSYETFFLDINTGGEQAQKLIFFDTPNPYYARDNKYKKDRIMIKDKKTGNHALYKVRYAYEVESSSGNHSSGKLNINKTKKPSIYLIKINARFPSKEETQASHDMDSRLYISGEHRISSCKTFDENIYTKIEKYISEKLNQNHQHFLFIDENKALSVPFGTFVQNTLQEILTYPELSIKDLGSMIQNPRKNEGIIRKIRDNISDFILSQPPGGRWSAITYESKERQYIEEQIIAQLEKLLRSKKGILTHAQTEIEKINSDDFTKQIQTNLRIHMIFDRIQSDFSSYLLTSDRFSQFDPPHKKPGISSLGVTKNVDGTLDIPENILNAIQALVRNKPKPDNVSNEQRSYLSKTNDNVDVSSFDNQVENIKKHHINTITKQAKQEFAKTVLDGLLEAEFSLKKQKYIDIMKEYPDFRLYHEMSGIGRLNPSSENIAIGLYIARDLAIDIALTAISGGIAGFFARRILMYGAKSIIRMGRVTTKGNKIQNIAKKYYLYRKYLPLRAKTGSSIINNTGRFAEHLVNSGMFLTTHAFLAGTKESFLRGIPFEETWEHMMNRSNFAHTAITLGGIKCATTGSRILTKNIDSNTLKQGITMTSEALTMMGIDHGFQYFLDTNTESNYDGQSLGEQFLFNMAFIAGLRLSYRPSHGFTKARQKILFEEFIQDPKIYITSKMGEALIFEMRGTGKNGKHKVIVFNAENKYLPDQIQNTIQPFAKEVLQEKDLYNQKSNQLKQFKTYTTKELLQDILYPSQKSGSHDKEKIIFSLDNQIYSEIFNFKENNSVSSTNQDFFVQFQHIIHRLEIGKQFVIGYQKQNGTTETRIVEKKGKDQYYIRSKVSNKTQGGETSPLFVSVEYIEIFSSYMSNVGKYKTQNNIPEKERIEKNSEKNPREKAQDLLDHFALNPEKIRENQEKPDFQGVDEISYLAYVIHEMHNSSGTLFKLNRQNIKERVDIGQEAGLSMQAIRFLLDNGYASWKEQWSFYCNKAPGSFLESLTKQQGIVFSFKNMEIYTKVDQKFPSSLFYNKNNDKINFGRMSKEYINIAYKLYLYTIYHHRKSAQRHKIDVSQKRQFLNNDIIQQLKKTYTNIKDITINNQGFLEVTFNENFNMQSHGDIKTQTFLESHNNHTPRNKGDYEKLMTYATETLARKQTHQKQNNSTYGTNSQQKHINLVKHIKRKNAIAQLTVTQKYSYAFNTFFRRHVKRTDNRKKGTQRVNERFKPELYDVRKDFGKGKYAKHLILSLNKKKKIGSHRYKGTKHNIRINYNTRNFYRDSNYSLSLVNEQTGTEIAIVGFFPKSYKMLEIVQIQGQKGVNINYEVFAVLISQLKKLAQDRGFHGIEILRGDKNFQYIAPGKYDYNQSLEELQNRMKAIYNTYPQRYRGFTKPGERYSEYYFHENHMKMAKFKYTKAGKVYDRKQFMLTPGMHLERLRHSEVQEIIANNKSSKTTLQQRYAMATRLVPHIEKVFGTDREHVIKTAHSKKTNKATWIYLSSQLTPEARSTLGPSEIHPAIKLLMRSGICGEFSVTYVDIDNIPSDKSLFTNFFTIKNVAENDLYSLCGITKKTKKGIQDVSIYVNKAEITSPKYDMVDVLEISIEADKYYDARFYIYHEEGQTVMNISHFEKHRECLESLENNINTMLSTAQNLGIDKVQLYAFKNSLEGYYGHNVRLKYGFEVIPQKKEEFAHQIYTQFKAQMQNNKEDFMKNFPNNGIKTIEESIKKRRQNPKQSTPMYDIYNNKTLRAFWRDFGFSIKVEKILREE